MSIKGLKTGSQTVLLEATAPEGVSVTSALLVLAGYPTGGGFYPTGGGF